VQIVSLSSGTSTRSLGSRRYRQAMAETQETIKFRHWCAEQCSIRDACKFRRQSDVTWEQLRDLCPKRTKENSDAVHRMR